MSSWEEFYASHLPPSDFEDNRQLLKQFCEFHAKEESQNVVLITSGGKNCKYNIDLNNNLKP